MTPEPRCLSRAADNDLRWLGQSVQCDRPSEHSGLHCAVLWVPLDEGGSVTVVWP